MLTVIIPTVFFLIIVAFYIYYKKAITNKSRLTPDLAKAHAYFPEDKKLINSLSFPLYIEDIDDCLLFYNNAFEASFSELWDVSSQKIKPNLAISKIFKEQNKEVLTTLKASRFIAVITNNQGTLQQVEYTKQPYFSENDALSGTVTTFDKLTPLSQIHTKQASPDTNNLLLLDKLVGGSFEFEYFSNGEGQFTQLSPGARTILGLSERALNQVGLTGCISPSILDEDRVNIAREFKRAGIDTSKIQCDFRYRESGRVSRCRFIAVKNKHSEIEVNGTSWFGLLLQLKDEGLLSDVNSQINDAQRTNSVEKGDVWQLCSDDESIMESLEFNQIRFQKTHTLQLTKLLNEDCLVIITKADLEQELGGIWLEKLKDFSGKMIIVADFKEYALHFSDSIIGLSFKGLNMTQFREIFNDFKIANKSSVESSTKILIAEDNEVNQLLVKNQLQPLGFDVTFASNGEVAYEKLNNAIFKAVITDFNMPISGGLELTSKIRSCTSSTIRNIPVIGLTADNSTETLESAKSVGVDYVLCKPYALDELHAKLVELIGLDRIAKSATLNVSAEDGKSLSYWVKIFGSKQDAIAMANVFYTTLKVDLAALKVAIENKNMSKCEMLLHRIKGSIAMVKIEPLRLKIESCEAVISNKKQIDNGVFTLIEELSDLNRAVYNWIS